MKKIKLPLEMANGVLVRTIDELKENWDLEKVINYYLNGKLLTWLNDRYYTELAEKVSALSDVSDNKELQKKLCNIFGMDFNVDAELIDVDAVAEQNRKVDILRKYTADDKLLKNIDNIAFNQEELACLLDKETEIIYLCENKFYIPLTVLNKKYVGIGSNVEAIIDRKEYVNFDKLKISFENIQFNQAYKNILFSSSALYKYGEDMEKLGNYVEAFEFYKKAGELGNSDGLFRAGKFYQEGRNGVEVNYELVRKYYEQAVSLNNPKAMNNLANMYVNGEGVAKDIHKAIELYKKAAELGNVTAMENLADRYYYGNDIAEDIAEAMKWYKKAGECGSGAAYNTIGVMYHNGKGVTKDYAEAMKWYRKAADLGNDWAMNNIGRLYFYGQGVNQNYAEAMRWYVQAADLGNADAMGKIGDSYYYGNGVNQDYEEALKWFRKGAEKGEAWVISYVGHMYHWGYGVNQDYVEAMKWYKKAVDLNDDWAMNRIGILYRDGLGVTANIEEAKKWFKKADDLGNDEAKDNLNSL